MAFCPNIILKIPDFYFCLGNWGTAMKKHRYQIMALILSLIMITGPLSGPVFAAQTSEGTEESTAVESSEMSEDIEAAEESEASNEKTRQEQ